jgi:hypothetical protein
MAAVLIGPNTKTTTTRADWFQRIPANIRCRVFCLPAFYSKYDNQRIQNTILIAV